MTSSILLVTGDDAAAMDVYRSQGCADWAQAMPLVLEKLGYLSFATAGPEALSRERTWGSAHVVLVARVPPDAWTPEATALARDGRAQALIEHPPAALHDALGIDTASPARRDGSVAAVSEPLRSLVRATTTFSRTRLEPPQSRDVPRDDELDWHRLGVPISEQQAAHWRAPGWRVERWSVDDGSEVLAEWASGDGGRWPAIISRGGLIGACFSLFGYLGQQTTVAPAAGSEYVNWSRSTGLDTLLAGLIDRLHQSAGIPCARVLPWPSAADWVLSTRHDYDRELSVTEIERILQGHRRAGSAATWYWRARYLDGKPDGDRNTIVRRIDRTGGQEVAHHTELLWSQSRNEQRAIEAAVGRAVSGSAAHGDPHCFRWQGAPNVLWAEQEGLRYTEFISHAHVHPHRFSALREDGTLSRSQVICLPHHVSLDRSANPGDAATESVLAHAEEYVRTGGVLQILSHPDVNPGALFELIGQLPRAGRLDLTAREMSEWWRRSHVHDHLTIAQGPSGVVTVTSATGVRGLVVEILDPNGGRRRHVVQLDPGATIGLGPPGGRSVELARRQRTLWLRRASPVLADAVGAYFVTQGISTDLAEVASTVATNTELVPTRVETITGYLRETQGVESLHDATILDLGSGFGSFATYVALDPGAPTVTAVDIRPEFQRAGREVASRLGLTNLDFRLGDMRSLPGLEDEGFDIVILNNSFIYLTSPGDMRSAISEISRVLSPGGHVVFFHANRWRFREPFTGDPVVHLLPPRLAGLVCRVAGWRHSHGRVLLVSAPWLARELRRRGFVNVRIADRARRRRTLRARIANYYAVTARKPER